MIGDASILFPLLVARTFKVEQQRREREGQQA